AFADVLNVPDTELLAKLKFRHSPAEELAADAKATEILEHSRYKDTMAEAGLTLEALRAHGKQLANLIRATLGEHIADLGQVVQNNVMFRTASLHDDELSDQVAGLPLGSKLVVNPWDGSVEYSRPELVAVTAPYEKGEFAVTPIMLVLTYAADNPAIAAKAVPNEPKRTAQAGTAAAALKAEPTKGGAGAKAKPSVSTVRSIPAGQKGAAR
ncbi:MAG: hypothetical protein ABI995_10205, partial [Acidobacteriota bacterium]